MLKCLYVDPISVVCADDDVEDTGCGPMTDVFMCCCVFVCWREEEEEGETKKKKAFRLIPKCHQPIYIYIYKERECVCVNKERKERKT